MLNKGIRFTVIVLLAGFIVLVITDKILQHGFKTSGEDVIGKMNALISDTTYYDVFCLGSSRTLAHIDPILIEKQTGLKTYNGGFNGASVFDFDIYLRLFLENRRQPRVVVIHIDDITLERNVTAELPKFFPYISNEFIYQDLVNYEPSVYYVRKLPFIRIMYYDDLMKWIAIKSLVGLKPRSLYETKNGFVNHFTSGSYWKGYWESKLPERYNQVRKPYEPGSSLDEGIAKLHSILDLCKERNIRVLFTSSPIIGGDVYVQYTKVTEIVEKAASGYPVSFYWKHAEQLDRKEYYYDHTHMVYRGAEKYSLGLAEQIKFSLN